MAEFADCPLNGFFGTFRSNQEGPLKLLFLSRALSIGLAPNMHVFVSYSREDSEAALQFVTDLQRQNINVWLDQNSQRGGDDWIEAIRAAIDGCSHFVLLMSPSSIASKTVRDEWTYARKVGVPIIPLMLRQCEPPFPLHTMNWIDLENEYDRGIKEVIRSLDEPGGALGNSQSLPSWYQWSWNKLRSFGHVTRRTAAGLGGMIVLIILGYLGYDLMKGIVSPCETIYEQTATRLGTKVEFLQSKGEIHVGKEQLQALPEAAQVMALNLKTCCVVLNEGKLDADEFLQCRTAAQNYESKIDSAVEIVEEAAKLQRSNETEAYARSLLQLRETLEHATEVSTSLGQQINSIVASQTNGNTSPLNSIVAKQTDGNVSPPAKTDSQGTDEAYGTIVANQADGNASPPAKTISHRDGVNGTISFQWDGETKSLWNVLQADRFGEYKRVAHSGKLRRGESQVVELAPGEYRVDMHGDRGFKAQDIHVKVGEDVAIRPVFGTVTFVWDGETKSLWNVLQADQFGEYKRVAHSGKLRRGESQVVELAPGEYRVDMHGDRGFKAQDIHVKVGEDVAIRPVFGTVTFVWDGETKSLWNVLQADQYGEYKRVAHSGKLRRGKSQVVELAPGEYRVDMHGDRGFKAQDIHVKVGEDVAIRPVFGTVTFVWDGETKSLWNVLQADQYGEYKRVAHSGKLRRGKSQVVELAPGKYRVRRNAKGATGRDVTVEINSDVLITE